MSNFPFLASLPNLITIGRLCLVPLIIAMITDSRWDDAFVIFLVAGGSDAVDGYLARRFHLQTELGAYLDPIADKALLVSIYVTLALMKVIPSTLAILVVSRDIMIVGAIVIARYMNKPVAIRPLVISKANTTAQIGFAAAMLAAQAFGFELGAWLHLCVIIVAALTLASAGAYLARWLAHMAT